MTGDDSDGILGHPTKKAEKVINDNWFRRGWLPENGVPRQSAVSPAHESGHQAESSEFLWSVCYSQSRTSFTVSLHWMKVNFFTCRVVHRSREANWNRTRIN